MSPSRARVVVVAGTDTGVGKTRVAAALAQALRNRGARVGVFKPAETGCEAPDRPGDALALVRASGCAEPLDRICPYRFREPLAPAVAARREGRAVDPAVLDRCMEALAAAHDWVIVEGAGGLLVPLAEGVLFADWVEARGLPVLLVGRLGLGTINHTLLSARHLRDRGIPLLGTVLSATQPPVTVAEETNPDVLAGYPEARLLGVLPHGATELPERVLRKIMGRLEYCRSS
ncbi:dethiobiotin synthase [Deferrisoma camini]|uniref:dethiobiotin synthase n=1 Tax=Deferrisoma camini TaxID=1035120 RepID=UPI00046D1184|nr:dethiobiotin synthase [Deferrisoma camini]